MVAIFKPAIFRPVKRRTALTSLQKEILSLKQARGAVILAHNYQIAPIQQVADYVGDSLGLAFKAKSVPERVIAFCGVHFMAETAKIINADKTVLMPDLEAGCSLADSCQAEKLQAWLDKNPQALVVAYINCSAAVKALSYVICTSGNAVSIVEKMPEDVEILFVPDQNLGRWVAEQLKRPLKLWPGNCYVHARFSASRMAALRQAYPQAAAVAHPECATGVRDLADCVCSTEKMIDFAKAQRGSHIIVMTETGMIHRLREEVPSKTFIAGPSGQCACNECGYMKLNNLEKLRDCLKRLSPQVELSSSLIRKARAPIMRMLDWSS